MTTFEQLQEIEAHQVYMQPDGGEAGVCPNFCDQLKLAHYRGSEKLRTFPDQEGREYCETGETKGGTRSRLFESFGRVSLSKQPASKWVGDDDQENHD